MLPRTLNGSLVVLFKEYKGTFKYWKRNGAEVLPLPKNPIVKSSWSQMVVKGSLCFQVLVN